MNQKNILIGVSALLVGIVGSGVIASYAVNGNHTGMMNMYGMHDGSSSEEISTKSGTTGNSMTMYEMATDLKGKNGDAFDQAFISEMIIHHQGAIDMANLALTNGNHQEVKDLAKNIVSAQEGEITQMKAWQNQWGYDTSTSMMDDHMMGQ